MFNKLKKKIKVVKFWAAIFGIIFIALIINSIYLTCKVNELSSKIEVTKKEDCR